MSLKRVINQLHSINYPSSIIQPMDLDLFLQSSPPCHQLFNQDKRDKQDNQNDHLSQIQDQNHQPQHDIQNNIGNNLSYENLSISNKQSSKRISSIMAGKRAREKKKMYVQTLEQRVKHLQAQISKYDQDIKDTKQALSKLVFSAKYNENKLTYAEIQSCVQAEDPNEDRINMLIDMIKFRVGGLGIQRQAKIDYFMKQLVNTLFLPIQRYLLYCSVKGIDIFKQSTIDELLDMEYAEKQSYLPWTKDFIASLNLSEQQKGQFLKMKSLLKAKKSQIHRLLHKINQIKIDIRQQEQGYESMIDQIRRVLNPIQGGFWLLFTDRIRYRGQIILDSERELFNEGKSVGFMPSKKLKKD